MPRTLPLLLLPLAACGTVVDAPPPEDAGPPPAALAPPLEATWVEAPVQYDVGQLLADIEAALPRRFGSTDERHPVPGKSRLDFAIALERSPIRYEFRGDTVDLAVTVAYRGKVWVDALVANPSFSCGLEGPAPRIRIRVRTVWRVAPDWTLRTRSRVLGIRPLTDTDRDRCRVSLLSVDVTDDVVGVARGITTAALRSADRTLRRADLRGEVAKLWDDLQQPLRITDSILWLQINPEGVALGPVAVRDSVAVAAVALRARPRFVAGPPPEPSPLPLPGLGTTTGDGGPATVLVEGVLPWDAAGRLLTDALRGRRLRLGWRTVTIDDVGIAPLSDGRVALGVLLRGRARGRIYVLGRVAYDSATRDVVVRDLELDVRTRRALLDQVAWLAEGAITGLLAGRARLPADSLLGRARDLANAELDRELTDGVHLEGRLSEAIPLGVTAGPEGLVAQARGTAVLRLRIRTPGLVPELTFDF